MNSDYFYDNFDDDYFSFYDDCENDWCYEEDEGTVLDIDIDVDDFFDFDIHDTNEIVSESDELKSFLSQFSVIQGVNV